MQNLRSGLCRWRRQLLGLAVLLLLGALFALPAAADSSRTDALEATDNPRVLFLTSYSYAWPTVPQQLEGIQSQLGSEVALTVRCMDTKSLNDAGSLERFYQQTKYLIEHTPAFDAVIVGDDDALKFVQDHRTELFDGIPVVFEAINKLDAAMQAAEDGLTTGVVEQMSYADNLALALQISPQAKRVVAILDDTVTGEGERAQFYAQAPHHPQLEFTEINVSQLTPQEFEQQLAAVEQDCILIYLIASADRSGRSYTNQQVCAMIEQYAPVPCYRFVSAGIGQGVLGGHVVSHYESGAIAARMVMQILNGTSPAQIPVVTESPTAYMFDYRVMQKYNIDRDLLPKEAELLYYEPTFWEAKGRAMAITAAVVLAVCCLLLVVVATRSVNKTNAILARKNEELADAIADAQKANRAKTVFLSSVSHDLRTPVSAIVNLTGLARRDLGDAGKMGQTLDRIDSASNVLQGIINDVLDLSAIENQKIKLTREPFRLQDLLADLANLYQGQCAEKGLQFTLETCDLGEDALVGDPQRLTRILMNLLTNACKFTPRGGRVRTEVRQLQRQDGRVLLRFTVEDTGCGIGKEAQQRIFQPFEQEDPSVGRRYGGSGLGLAIVKELVDLHNGTIACHSEKGQGTTFVMELPFALAAAEESPYRELRVLLAEEDRAVRATVSDLLTSLGVRYDEADRDQAAGMLTAARAEGRPYGLCLVGWAQADVGGLELVRRIRSMFDRDALAVLVMAQKAVERVELQARAGGADHFTARPVTAAVLQPVLEQCAARSRAKREQAVQNYDFGGRRVLLAEDEAMSAEPLVELLQRANLRVDWVQDGAQAVERFSNAMPGEYAAILLDIQMPEMDGYEAARAIRISRHPSARTIPLVAVSGRVFADAVAAARSAGMNDHVSKPINSRILFETLAKYIK